jgi:hypothetical protein
VKIAVRCPVFDGGKPHGRKLGTIVRETLPGPRLRWDERYYRCDKQGAMQVHDEDMLRLALNSRVHEDVASRHSVMARSVLRMGDP